MSSSIALPSINGSSGYLQEIKENGYGKIYYLMGNRTLIGRNYSAEIAINSCSVSRNHALLNYTKKGWTVVDNRSVNGVYVNGRKLEPMVPYLLKDGQKLSLGPPSVTKFKFEFHLCANQKNTQNQQETVVDRPVPGCSRSCLPPESSRRNLRKRLTRSDMDSPLPADAKRPCPDDSELSLRERLAAIDSQMKVNEEVDRRVKEILNRSDERLSQNSEVQSTQNSQSLLRAGSPVQSDDASSEGLTQDCLPRVKRKKDCPSRNTRSKAMSESVSEEQELKDLREKVAALEKQLQERDQAKMNLQKELQAKVALLEKQAEQHDEVKKEEKEQGGDNKSENVNSDQENLKAEVANQFGKLMEAELTCVICTELFVKATTLECSHTFCYKCITEWKKSKKDCPICRTHIKGQTKSLVIDNFIDKMVEKLSPEYQERRKEVVKERTVPEKKKKTPKRTRSRSGASSSRSSRSRAVPAWMHIYPLDVEDVDEEEELEVVPLGELDELAFVQMDDFSDMSDDNDDEVPGYGYYGGYGRCYNCGRPGHWANGCPDL